MTCSTTSTCLVLLKFGPDARQPDTYQYSYVLRTAKLHTHARADHHEMTAGKCVQHTFTRIVVHRSVDDRQPQPGSEPGQSARTERRAGPHARLFLLRTQTGPGPGVLLIKLQELMTLGTS